MSPEKFSELRKDLLEIKKQQEDALNLQYHEYVDEFVKVNSPIQLDKVYELTNDVFKSPRGCKRFVAYTCDVKWVDENPIIIVGGWWLNNKTNIPQRWDTIPSFGISGLPTVKLSDDQTNLPHPDSEEANVQFER